MPITLLYEIYDTRYAAPVFASGDKILAVITQRELTAKGIISSIRHKLIPKDMTKQEEYLYLVYEVRKLQRAYFASRPRDREIFKEAIDKETQLDHWNQRTRSYLNSHPRIADLRSAEPSFAFFVLVEQWRKLWKQYFAYKKRQDAEPEIIRQRFKECRDYEQQIDSYLKKQLNL